MSLPTAPVPPEPPAPRRREGLLRQFRVEATVLLFVLVFLAAVVVPTWLLGGFERQPEPPLPRIQVGTTVQYGEFKIKPIGAKLFNHHPTSEYDDKKNMAYLVLQVTMENRTKNVSYPSFGELFLLQEPVFTKETGPESVGLVKDNSQAGVLYPHVPETLQAIWPIPDEQAAKIGETLEIVVQRNEFSEGYFSQRDEWRLPKPWLVVVTPVVREEGV